MIENTGLRYSNIFSFSSPLPGVAAPLGVPRDCYLPDKYFSYAFLSRTPLSEHFRDALGLGA